MTLLDGATTFQRRFFWSGIAYAALGLVAAWLPPLQPQHQSAAPAASAAQLLPGRAWEFDRLPEDLPARDRLHVLAATIGLSTADLTIGTHSYVLLRHWQTHQIARDQWETSTVDIEMWVPIDGGCDRFSRSEHGVYHLQGTCGWRDGPLPDGPDFITWLNENHPTHGYPPAAIDRLTTIPDKEGLLTRGQRAAVLHDLADRVPNLRWRGPVTDRMGRAGVAVSAKFPYEHQMLIISPATGEILAAATQLQRIGDSPSGLPVEWYVLYVDRRFTFNVPRSSLSDRVPRRRTAAVHSSRIKRLASTKCCGALRQQQEPRASRLQIRARLAARIETRVRRRPSQLMRNDLPTMTNKPGGE